VHISLDNASCNDTLNPERQTPTGPHPGRPHP